MPVPPSGVLDQVSAALAPAQEELAQVQVPVLAQALALAQVGKVLVREGPVQAREVPVLVREGPVLVGEGPVLVQEVVVSASLLLFECL